MPGVGGDEAGGRFGEGSAIIRTSAVDMPVRYYLPIDNWRRRASTKQIQNGETSHQKTIPSGITGKPPREDYPPSNIHSVRIVIDSGGRC